MGGFFDKPGVSSFGRRVTLVGHDILFADILAVVEF